jgi:hypothetical protein
MVEILEVLCRDTAEDYTGAVISSPVVIRPETRTA